MANYKDITSNTKIGVQGLTLKLRCCKLPFKEKDFKITFQNGKLMYTGQCEICKKKTHFIFKIKVLKED